MKTTRKRRAAKKSTTARTRPVKDLAARQAPRGGADGSVRFLKDTTTVLPAGTAAPSGIQVVMADGSVRF